MISRTEGWTASQMVGWIEAEWQSARAEVSAAAGEAFARTVDQLVADARRCAITRRTTAHDPEARMYQFAAQLLTANDILRADELPGSVARQEASQRISRLASSFLELREALTREVQ